MKARLPLASAVAASILLLAASAGFTLHAAETQTPMTKSSATDPQQFNWPRIYAMAQRMAEKHPDRPELKELAALALAQLPPVRLPQSPVHLTSADQKRFQQLAQRVGQWTSQSPTERAKGAESLLTDVKRFAGEFPDLTAVWLLEAQMALIQNKPLEGRVAADNLDALCAWQGSKPEVLSLLTGLLLRDWIPSSGLVPDDAARFKELVQDHLKQGKENAPATAREDLLKRVKVFNSAHPDHAYGWLLQYELARLGNRPADQSVALGRLHPARDKAKDVAKKQRLPTSKG